MIKTGVWALSNICRGKPRYPPANKAKIVDFFVSVLLGFNDRCLIIDSAWALDALLSNGSNIERLYQKNLASRLKLLLEEGADDPNVLRPLARIVGQMATVSASYTQELMNLGIIESLRSLEQFSRRSLLKDYCWVLSNIAAGPRTHCDALVRSGALGFVLTLFKESECEDILKESVWTICNFVIGCSFESMEEMLSEQIIELLVVRIWALRDDLLLKISVMVILRVISDSDRLAVELVEGLKNAMRTSSYLNKLLKTPITVNSHTSSDFQIINEFICSSGTR